MLALGLPPQRESVRIQESSIPSPCSPDAPLWTDAALRMVLVNHTDESALLIPCQIFLDQISAAQTCKQATPERIEAGAGKPHLGRARVLAQRHRIPQLRARAHELRREAVRDGRR